MAPRSDRDELQDAWRALAGQPSTGGWRTIAVCAGRGARFLAGRSPSDAECLLVEVGLVPDTLALPSSRGFQVDLVDGEMRGDGPHWIGLGRRPSGNLDLFTTMAGDVVATVGRRRTRGAGTLAAVIDRVRAWQAFMDRMNDGPLSPEREVGLVGELVALEMALQAGVPDVDVCEGWQGPVNGLQDFRWGCGAFEVKATVETSTFPARISSLDQLDDALTDPLFLVGIRLKVDPGGRSLPGVVDAIRSRLSEESTGSGLFEDRLLASGYADAHRGHYTRSFSCTNTLAFRVTNSFPRITRSMVPGAVQSARYVLDIDLVREPSVPFTDVLASLGRH